MNSQPRQNDEVVAKLASVVRKLQPLAIPLKEPDPDDWLADHWEPGQTFLEYIHSNPTRATRERNKIYIAPLGHFEEAQKKILDRAAEFLSAFYGLPVVVQDPTPVTKISRRAQRIHPEWGDFQILTSYIREKLAKHLPPDAATYLCFTTCDLWPRKGWNFVFGQASYQERVGVWSVYRYGDPSQNQQQFQKCLGLVLKTMVHETGHMFGIRHCTAYNCGMCGSNHLQESASHPIYFCPECTPKVHWATGVDLVQQAQKLHGLCEQWGLSDPAAYYAKSYEILSEFEGSTWLEGGWRLLELTPFGSPMLSTRSTNSRSRSWASLG
jgi:archaemetzincin